MFVIGASHSFISNELMGRLNFNPTLVSNPLCVSNPIGGSTNINTACLGVPITYRNRIFSCNLYVLGFMGFEVLLGMDWLTEHEAILDCIKKNSRNKE